MTEPEQEKLEEEVRAAVLDHLRAESKAGRVPSTRELTRWVRERFQGILEASEHTSDVEIDIQGKEMIVELCVPAEPTWVTVEIDL